MRGFVQIPIIVIILLIAGGAIAAYTITYKNPAPQSVVNQQNESSNSATESTKTSEPPKQAEKSPSPTLKPISTPLATPAPSLSPQSSVKLESVSPTSGKVGDVIIIKGSGFGKSSFYYPDPTQFKGMVSFYGPSGQNSGGAPSACTEDWDYSCWSDNQIKVKVPGVKPSFTFQVEVTSSDGQKSNRVSFEVLN